VINKFETKTAPRDVQETVISYQSWSDEWKFYSNAPKHIRKWRALVMPTAEGYNELGNLVSLTGTITGASVRIAKQRVLTPEQRELAARRLAEARNGK
jgi:hypothetical protein